jgi:type IV pilus assembly protein PilY1
MIRKYVMVAALAALLLSSSDGGAADQAACKLYPTDGIAGWDGNGEDVEFFTNQGGVPNVMFILDNSGSINRMAPDGAVNTWGAPTGDTYGCSNPLADGFVYHSPCSKSDKENTPYDGAVDYAAAASVCPYLDSGNQIRTGAPGFDPDIYPQFFPTNAVYHDNDFSGGAWNATCDTTSTVGSTSFCKGFEENGAYAAAASIGGYCNAWQSPSNVVLSAAELTARRASCNTCLSTKGFWYSGFYYANNFLQNLPDPAAGDGTSPKACGNTTWCTSHGLGVCVDRATRRVEYNGGDATQGVCRYPHLYFTGNFLNFRPPKFVVLRKVMKDVLMDVKRVRLGFATFDGNSGGILNSKLNPSCNLVYPPSPSSFDSNRSSTLTAIKAVNFTNSTPLAETLLNVGQYYRSSGLPWFNSTYRKAGASTKNFEPGAGNQASVCFACQKSAVIIITDGLSNLDSAIPGTDFAANPMTIAAANTAGNYAGMAGYNIKEIDATTCPCCNRDAEMPEGTVVDPASGTLERALTSCTALNPIRGACGPTGPTYNYLPKVAWYLHHMDFQSDSVKGADCAAMGGKQSLDVYTVGYGLSAGGKALLEDTAYRDPNGDLDKDVGGGLSKSADDASTLRQAILEMLDDVNTRSTSFGAAAVANVSASADIRMLVPRFDPRKGDQWPGHLYKMSLWNEFGAGCKATIPGQPFDPNDKDCDRKCDSLFFRDQDGAFFQENSSGRFVKNSPTHLAPCSPTNYCGSCGALGTTLARPIWDAADVLNSTSWRNRNVWTAVDVDLDGTIEPGEEVQLADDPAVAKQLIPYMNLGGTTCETIKRALDAAGNAADSAAIGLNPVAPGVKTGIYATPREYTNCALTIIRYLLGADVLNENAAQASADTCRTPVLAAPTFREDRPFKLGDVFHSSPIEVLPPILSSKMLFAFHEQFLPTLWEHQDPNGAYDTFAGSQYGHDQKFHIVGANDGMLHAFLTGTWHPGDDPSTPTPRIENGWWDDGTGAELWAFIPPDLLSKTPQMLGTQHTFFVDATPFVRTIWVEGTRNGRFPTGGYDDVKQPGEFHTVAVMGERRGGSHYFALDLTDAYATGFSPRFLWIYPPPGHQESVAFGLTYQDQRPAPPTIGPVRVDARTDYPASASTPEVKTCAGATAPYHERWITFLSGGLDLSNAKGHGVHMVDVWTGKELFDFSQPDSASGVSATDPRWELRFPVAATVGMVAFGCGNVSLFGENKDTLFFDTATFGDMGGQLWTLRFFEPARLDGTTGLATNWFGGRLLQTGRIGCSTASLGQPFYGITANVINSTDGGTLHVVAGTGDRFNLLDYDGGLCGPDNIRACLLQGCTVTVNQATSIDSIGQYSVAGVTSSPVAAACYPMTHAFAPASGTCDSSTGRVQISITACPNPVNTGDTSTSRTRGVTCTQENETWSCAPAWDNDDGVALPLNNVIRQGNWFFSLRAFGSGRPNFDDAAGARAYDDARLTETSPTIVKIDASLADPPIVATHLDDGWLRYFTHSGSITVNGQPFTQNPIDERVVSGTVVQVGNAYFNTMQPLKPVDTAAAGSCSKSPCKSGRAQNSYLYGVQVTTGHGALFDTSGSLIPPVARIGIVPPQVPQVHVFVNNAGEVTKGLVSTPVGANPSNMTVSGIQDPSSNFGWIDLDPQLHACRHLAVPQACRP